MEKKSICNDLGIILIYGFSVSVLRQFWLFHLLVTYILYIEKDKTKSKSREAVMAQIIRKREKPRSPFQVKEIEEVQSCETRTPYCP